MAPFSLVAPPPPAAMLFRFQFKVSYRVDSCIKHWGRPGHKRRLVYLTSTIDKVSVVAPVAAMALKLHSRLEHKVDGRAVTGVRRLV